MTRTIIGSVLLISSLFCAAEPTNLALHVLNLDKQPIEHVIIGQPFLLAIEYDIHSGGIVSPSVEGLDAFSMLSSRISHTSIGTTVHVRCEYTLRADFLDTCTVGPVTIGSKSYGVSRTIQVKEAPARDTRQLPVQPFAQLTVSDTNPIVGQAVEFVLTLYVPKNHAIEVIGMHIDDRSFLPYIKDISPIQEQCGECVWNGQECRFISWTFSFKPEHAATFTIPACSVDFSPVEKRSLFASFWGARAVKREFSNAVTMTVSELDPSYGPVHIIAAEPTITARLDTDHVAAGDAIEYAIMVESDYPLAIKDAFTLSGLPDGVRAYSSSPKIRSTGLKSILDVGFVLQCMQDGDITIPGQVLRVYDTAKRDIVEVFLGDIALHIDPSPVGVQELLKVAEQANERVQVAAAVDSVASFEQQLLARALPVIRVGTHTGVTDVLVWFLVVCVLLLAITPLYWHELAVVRLKRSISLHAALLYVWYAWLTRNPRCVWPAILLFLRYRGVKGVISQQTSVHSLYTQLGLDSDPLAKKTFLQLWNDLVRARLYPQEYRDGALYRAALQWLRDYRHVR